MDKETERYLTGGEVTARDAVVSPVLYWPKGIVYYKFDEALGMLLTVEMIFIVIPHTVCMKILLAVQCQINKSLGLLALGPK